MIGDQQRRVFAESALCAEFEAAGDSVVLLRSALKGFTEDHVDASRSARCLALA